MKPEICVFLIVGMSPLLQNNPSAFIGKSGNGETLTSKKEYDDDEEAKLRVYLDPTGKHCHPCEAFIKAIIRAVTGKKFGNLAATSMIKGSVFIAEPFVIIEDENGNPKTDYSIDKRPVVIGKARVAFGEIEEIENHAVQSYRHVAGSVGAFEEIEREEV